MMAMGSTELIRKHGSMESNSGKMEIGILSPWIRMNSKAKIYGRIQQGVGMIAFFPEIEQSNSIHSHKLRTNKDVSAGGCNMSGKTISDLRNYVNAAIKSLELLLQCRLRRIGQDESDNVIHDEADDNEIEVTKKDYSSEKSMVLWLGFCDWNDSHYKTRELVYQ
ncbi:hypothetical protein L1887_20077 [Cichorium endivia]|nr:hypothetical protein L1887_20077 [Cichorium endivia]